MCTQCILQPIVISELGTVSPGLEKRVRGICDQRKNRDHPDLSSVKIIKNTQLSSGDLS